MDFFDHPKLKEAFDLYVRKECERLDREFAAQKESAPVRESQRGMTDSHANVHTGSE